MRLALLGDPVDHSRSPAIHAAALRHLGIDGDYRAIRTDGAGVAAAVERIRRGDLVGANVTMPLKRVALDAVDTASLEAIRAGAVNTILLHDGGVRGDNTDVAGIGDVWEHRGLDADAPVLVLGAGGAAGAVLVALDGRHISLSARRLDAAVALTLGTGVAATTVPWGEPVAGAVVVNATPLGMHGESLPEDVLAAATGLFDLAYGDAVTPAVEWAAGRIPVADGIDHLVAQAARSFTLWTGLAAPREVMEAAGRV